MKSLRFVCIFAAALSLSPALASAQSNTFDSALIYETTISSSAEGLGIDAVLHSLTTEAPGKVRVEMLARKESRSDVRLRNPSLGEPGSYTLTLEGGRVMYGVDPARREYYRMGIEDAGSTLGQMSKLLGSAEVKFSGIKIKIDSIGAGDIVLGHRTTRWKIQQTITMTMVIQGDTLAMTSESTTDSFFAADVAHMPAPKGSEPLAFESSTLSLAREFAGPDSAQMLKQLARLPRTLMLRSVQRTSMMTGLMDIISTTKREVTRLEKQRINDSLFMVPMGYKLTAMPIEAKSLSGINR